MKHSLLHFFLNFAFVLSISTIFSCCEEEIKEMKLRSDTIINNLGGAGGFVAINLSTNDTVHISGALSIYLGGTTPQKLFALKSANDSPAC